MSLQQSNAAGGIHGLLLKLHEALADPDIRRASLRAQDLVRDLGQTCMLTPSDNELALQTSLLFSKDYGLLIFLRESLPHDEVGTKNAARKKICLMSISNVKYFFPQLRDARIKTLCFLEKFLEKLSPKVKGWEKTYAIDIRDTCMTVYTKDRTAKCRTADLELLIKVLLTTKASTVAAEMRIGEIFTKFYTELCHKSKLPDSVLSTIYGLLGIIAEVHPSDMVNYYDKLYKAYRGELKEQMTSATKEPKLIVVAGCLRGITALMVNFTKTMEEDPETSKEIFQYSLKAISPQMEMSRYAVTFAGLRLFARHASQFSSCLISHYREVFDAMSKLCGHINTEMKKTSYYALEAFLKQVSILVAENIEEHKSKLKFFMQKFCNIIKTMESTHKELSIAIRGYGFFAAPCKKVCPQDVELMYTELIQRCKQMYLTESDREDESFYQLPSFLDSIASVLIHLDKVPEVYTPLLERLVVVQIDSFPQYSEKMQITCCRAIIKVLVAMASKGPVLWSFISSVVHQGLIRVCSKPMVTESKDSENDSFGSSEVRIGKAKIPSSKNYLALYRGLLDCDRLKDSGFLDGAFEHQNAALVSLSRILYDELVKSLLLIIEKLDLSLQKVTPGEEASEDATHVVPSSDPTAHLLPNKMKDFTAFINLVDFCSELLLHKHIEYFQTWMYPFSHKLILQSLRNPLVSGFYKLLSVTMKIAEKIKYYKGVESSASTQGDTVRSACFALFSKFGKEVCVKMKQYKDELLASCLTFVLSLHHNIVAVDIKVYCPALEAALKLGLSHVPLANAALHALEDWSSHIPPENMEPCYKLILPLLDGYLKTNGNNDKEDGVWEVMSSLSSRSDVGYSRVLTRLLKKSNQLAMEDAPLTTVRLRVVKLLGHLGGKLNRNLITVVSSEEMMKKFVAWDTEKRLSFPVPFTDMKPVIYLDPFLPRISELALSTSDRQTKVAACELLHSLVLYMVGKSAQMVEGENRLPPMYKLHKRLFPVLLRLACDVDQVTRQLFEPLVMQLIHWFTNNKKFESQDTVAVLEAILNGIVDPKDSTLRDFSGRCIEEFVKWSIKQTSPKQQEKSPANMKSLFKRIYSLALHPSGFKRLGAALAFNSIYRQFREENSLVEQFIFEVLVIFVESLALAHTDERSMGTLQQCGSSIDHLKRIIKYKAPALNNGNPKRRIPRGFPVDEKICLSDMVLWLLEQCGRPQTECRHKCLELFYEFVPLLPGKKSPPQWLEGVLNDHGVAFLVGKFEGGGLLSQPTLRNLVEPFSVKATLHWMDLLLAALDCYNTFINLHIIKPNHMLNSKDESSFLQAVRFFLTELATQELAAAEGCFHHGQKNSHFSPIEVEQYNYSKCTIIVRLLEFTTMVLVKGGEDFCKLLEEDIFSAVFFELTAMVVCQPSSVGFNMADVDIIKNLPEVCIPLLKALQGSPYHAQVECNLKKRISHKSVEQLCAVDLYHSGHHGQMEMVLSSCKQIHKAGFLCSILKNQDSDPAKSLLLTVYNGIAPGDRKSLPSLDINSKKLAEGLLQLAFSLSPMGEQLLDILLTGSHGQSFLSFSHPEYFYSLFPTAINTELLRNINKTVPRLMMASSLNPSMVSVVLNGMLDHSFRERSVRKTQGKQLVEEVLGGWNSLQSWWDGHASNAESKTATLLLLSKLLQIDSSVCSNVNHEGFKPVFSTFTKLLVDTSLPLNLKSQALLVLPFFTTVPEEQLAELQGALESLVASHFPMQSDEFAKGSLHRNNYMDCIRKLLDALELSHSPLLLKLLAEILCRDRKHIMEEQFQTCFQRIAKRPSSERQLQLLCTIYGMIQKSDVPRSSVLQAMVERVLLPLTFHCSTKTLIDFFVANVSNIMTLLLSRVTKASESAFEMQLLKKNGCFKLMELLYSRLPKEEVYSKDSRINSAYCGTDKTEGNELSKKLLKSCFETFTENMAGETQLLEIRRQYHCAAYNCAMAAVSCSFSEPKFYSGFLFSDKPEKSQFILENIIDVERTYNFPVVIEVPLERKKKYTMIRKEVSEENGEAPVYLSSQSYMADSSLSEEMSQFDFSTGIQSFSYSSQNPEGQRRTIAKATDETPYSPDAAVDLEMDELNQHECMANMTALIGHMQRNNITPKIEQGKVPSDLPPWMKFLHGKLMNPATPLNIRLFISKLIINTEEVFRPYAKHWLGPLLQLVVSENNGGEGIHFMVVDIVVTVLSWTSLARPKGNVRDEVLANRLLEFLMKHSFHSRRSVFRHNLEIIRTLVECWKDCLYVPHSLIYERFCGTDPNSKNNSVGLQLLGIILANNLPAYDASCGIQYDRYIKSLTNNITIVRYKDVYSAAAEIIGLILKNMTDNEKHNQELLSLAAHQITSLKKKEMNDKFIICVNKVSKHFPPFMDGFVNPVLYQLPKMHGTLKINCLECVLSRADVIPDIFLQLKTTGFIQIMGYRDEAMQIVCLDIIHKILPRLTPAQLQEFLMTVTSFVSHPSPVCRERMYDILMWIQDNYSDDESMSDNTSLEILNAAKETLLQGLSEENQGLQLYVRNFWSQEKRLPTATLERMLTVLRSLYTCRIERCFLSLATNLLLEMTSQSPDFKRNIFEYPLSECTFQDYLIDSNWRFRNTVMTPMFVETQNSQGPESVAPSQSGAMKGKLRATQTSLQFTQTQIPGRHTAYNWLTGSSVDTFAEYSPSESSLMVFEKKAARQSTARRPVGEGFGQRRIAASTDEVDNPAKAENERRQKILQLRRRFLKDQEESLIFAQKEVQKQKRLKEQKADQRLRKEAQVTLYRNYRVGDFPDVQIPYSNLIAPLQAVAQRDPILAKQLFSSLFTGILEEMETQKPRQQAVEIKEDLRCIMNEFLSKSTLCFPPFIACVQDMCYRHKDLLHIDPALVSSTSLASLQQPSGVLLLEEGLLHIGMQDEPPRKKSRGSKEIPPDTKKWVHLARLYRDLEDYDVVRGIFAGKVGTMPITSAALQAEACTDFAEAAKLYNEALNTKHWTDGEPTDSEKDFWEIAAMEAYSHLTDWKSLQYCSTYCIDENSSANLDNMWLEPLYQEMYLPHMIRSMLKLLQLGEGDQSLLTFMDQAMKVEERKKLLESRYSQELSLLYILQEDYDRAKYYTNSAMQIFMESYSSVDTLLTQSRLTILQSVQALTEIQDFLQFMKGEVSVTSLKRLIDSWTERYPDAKMDPVNIWDDIITSRFFFLDKIREKLQSDTDTDGMEVDNTDDAAEDLEALVNNCKFNMKLHMADSARKQNNFSVATKLMKELHKDAKTDRKHLLRWVHTFSRYGHKRIQAQGPLEQVNIMIKAVRLLEDIEVDCQNASSGVYREQKILQGTSFHIMAMAVRKSPSVLQSIEAEKADTVVKLSNSAWPIQDMKEVEVGLQLRALTLMRDAAKKADEELQISRQSCAEISSIVETYMCLADFCDKLLRQEDQGDTNNQFPDLLTLPAHVVRSMLKALKMNSEEARLKFPRLLQLIELYPSETLDLMTNEMASVPCWMLIGWISQMVALLDKPQAVAVQDCIEQLAEFYPQALVYALMISSESYHFEDSAIGHRQQEFVNRMKSMLDRGEAVKKFVDALQQLTNPEMIFRDWWENVKNQLEKPDFSKEKMESLYNEMYSSLGDWKKEGHGIFRQRFIKRFAKDMQNLLGSKGSKVFEKRKQKVFLKSVDEFASSMRERKEEPRNLKEYSPWLSAFQADPFRNQLEIPGQYDGKSKPLPEYHAKITGFDERVKVMSSMRRPKRLIIRGDDERDHPFLVKGGEDLRQDQRIEQLFAVMNILLSRDAACARRGLQLRTYQVIPINTRIGLIEWMENTCTLREFLTATMTEEESHRAARSGDIYNKWLSSFSSRSENNPLKFYVLAYMRATRDNAVDNFSKMSQQVPADLLKRAFLKMCNSPEAFLSLRSHFISSHALLCVSHWVLGIGDRHLSNFMINTETGGMIGIDFGHAFGSATQFLNVPELMPFRLTGQFVNLMQPLKESGLIQSVMAHALRAYRNEPDLLLNTMDVFVKEPSLDWKNFEIKQLKKGGTWTESVNTKEINWYPLQKVNFARRKLEGANPATITSEELKLGFEGLPGSEGMKAVALGTPEHNVRAREASEGLSVEKQVECLLDQATDANVLGRVYAGWEPWI
ncbi:DNA-dependent protein kinase catalytic subunit isoform X2 [Syngnathus typhle]|uniref:DNA-dependent protein kinase catalytic subunit isoform X2 n=1 Tax=Syngnathus typhle TaxID=161592 RepID=UPI002A69AA80|nr:DNA-dependent protein kinase catalytic subunit isoform X2 [Syngnathus typhle]